MTFVIAKLTDPGAGQLTLYSDTKITHRNDSTFTRQTLANPGQKVVIVNDDVVVGFAGDTPESAVNRVAELRGRSVDEIEGALLSISDEMNQAAGLSKSFLVVARKPEPRITVISRGQQEDRTAIGTGWVGDREAFLAYSEVFQDPSAPAGVGLGQRFATAMLRLIQWEEVETVGGYLVRVNGSRDKPFRFMPDATFVMPDETEGSVERTPDGNTTFAWSLADGADPTVHRQLLIPGTGPTYSALAQYIPESGAARLHTHEYPGDAPIRLEVKSLSELVQRAESEYGQHLDPTQAQRTLRGDHPEANMLYVQPYPENETHQPTATSQ